MSRDPVVTEIETDEGIAFYNTIPFSYDQGIDLLSIVSEIMAETIGKGIGAMAGGNLLDADLGVLGEAVSSLPRMLQSKGGAQLVARFFKATKCKRPDSGEWLDLGTAVGRDRAFCGNYAESLEALAWVIEINFGPFSGPTNRWRRLWSKGAGLLSNAMSAEATQSSEANPG